MSTPIDECPISIRTCNALLNQNIRTVEDLSGFSHARLLRIPGIGRVALHELLKVAREHGLVLEEDSPCAPRPPRPRPPSPFHERNMRIVEMKKSGKTYEAIAAQFGISPPRARQIVERERKYARTKSTEGE